MEQTSFELTPKQKSILATLSRATGKPVPALLDEALEGLQEHERSRHAKDETNGNREAIAPKPIWEQFAEVFDDVSEEELARLPTDLAAQVDHYVYGLPKR
jgi:DNA-binding MarR family transcriptional regulator